MISQGMSAYVAQRSFTTSIAKPTGTMSMAKKKNAPHVFSHW